MTTHADVVVVGAGLAGLRAAQLLSAQDHDVLLLEASDGVGGRVRSRWVDGYLIDQGFQLINPSYPELRASGVLASLDLHAFDPVIRYVDTDGFTELVDPRWSPLGGLRSLRQPYLSLRDGLAIGRLLLRARTQSPQRLMRGADCSTRDGLMSEGISETAINGALQPFLRGTILDEALDTSWHYTLLLLKAFTSGRPGVPRWGAQALPDQLLAMSGARIHFNEPATSVSATSVTTAQATYTARAVIVATDATTQATLLDAAAPRWRSQTAYWCATPRRTGSAQLRIDAVRGLWSTLDITAVAPNRAPEGRSLVVASAVGDVDDPRVTQDVARLYGIDPSEVTIIERQVIAKALPAVARPLDLHAPVERHGVFVAGDFLQTPSIQGAMFSGRRAAAAAMRALSTQR